MPNTSWVCLTPEIFTLSSWIAISPCAQKPKFPAGKIVFKNVTLNLLPKLWFSVEEEVWFPTACGGGGGGTFDARSITSWIGFQSAMPSVQQRSLICSFPEVNMDWISDSGCGPSCWPLLMTWYWFIAGGKSSPQTWQRKEEGFRKMIAMICRWGSFSWKVFWGKCLFLMKFKLSIRAETHLRLTNSKSSRNILLRNATM